MKTRFVRHSVALPAMIFAGILGGALCLASVFAVNAIRPADSGAGNISEAQDTASPPAETGLDEVVRKPPQNGLETQGEAQEGIDTTTGRETQLRAPDVAKNSVSAQGVRESPEVAAAPILDSVPLSAQEQSEIYGLCGGDERLFCSVMAIARRESNFRPNAIGDGGSSLGMMQINYRMHQDRINALGVRDLLNPVECAAVAISYIRELAEEFRVDVSDHVLYVAYRYGSAGARELFSQGIYSTSYTWDIAGYFDAYMRELSEAA